MIVNGVCKVIGGDSVCFEKNEILDVFGHFYLALYLILNNYLSVFVAVGAKSYGVGNSCLDLFLLLLDCKLTAGGIFSVIAGVCALLFLLFAKRGKLLLCAEAGICEALENKLLCKCLIDVLSEALLIGAVFALLAVLA